jgi:hypothetical protein
VGESGRERPKWALQFNLVGTRTLLSGRQGTEIGVGLLESSPDANDGTMG